MAATSARTSFLSGAPSHHVLAAILLGLSMQLGTGVSAADEAKPAEAKPAEAKPADAQPAEKGNPWVVNCSTGTTGTTLECQASQNLTEAKTGQRVLTVTVRRQNDSAALAMILALPHGLYLPAGASYQIDAGQKATVAIQTSDQNGAYAALPLSTELLAAMKTGTNLNIGMEAATRKPITIPVTLAGFTAAIDKLEATK
ncbi:MAG: invasion associated locus B family protein [Mesorhizobium sp.]